MKHVKRQEKENDSIKKTRGRTAAEEGVTDTNTRDLPEARGWAGSQTLHTGLVK